MQVFKKVDSVWEITETTRLFGLALTETGKIVAPEGKLVTLVYNGENIPLTPGQYEGDVVLEVTDTLKYQDLDFRAAVVMENGKPVPEKSVKSMAVGGANLLAGGPPAGMPPMGAGGPPAGMPPMGAGGPHAGFPAPGGDFPAPPAGMPPMGDFPAPGGDMPPMPEGGFDMPDFGGPKAKNLSVTLENVQYIGRITASVSKHRVPKVSKENAEELGEVVNTPAPVCNNGVIVTLDGKTVWNVTADCYLSSLTIAEGSEIKDAKLTEDGNAVELNAGIYTGDVRLTV